MPNIAETHAQNLKKSNVNKLDVILEVLGKAGNIKQFTVGDVYSFFAKEDNSVLEVYPDGKIITR